MASPSPAKTERGCFQCSRRRIVCDKNEPTCIKCVIKGIECSGPGRIRFAEGVARRGRLKGCKIPKAKGDELRKGDDLPTRVNFQSLTWPGDGRTKKRRRVDLEEDMRGIMEPTSLLHEPAQSLSNGESAQMSSTLVEIRENHHDNAEEIDRCHDALAAFHSPILLLPWIAPVDPQTRMAFSYFSQTVAPAMVVLDDDSNGYRSLVLPMALEDDLLRRAVGVVAAQHLSREKPELKHAAEAGRIAVISRLRRDSLKQSADKVFNKFTWATLIVLLVGETVTASTDFGFFVQMLLCLSMNSLTHDVDPALMAFLQAQTHMFELLGVPLLGEEIGLLTVTKASDSLMAFLSYSHLPKHSEDRRVAQLIRRCFVSACDIYARSATTTTNADTDTDSTFGISHHSIQEQVIQQLISTMMEISPSARGAHALVWVCFVAGAAATCPAQRAFFVHRMNQAYACTRFGNIPAAVQSLENIWSSGVGKRWTLCLPQLSNVLVM